MSRVVMVDLRCNSIDFFGVFGLYIEKFFLSMNLIDGEIILLWRKGF